MSPLPLEELYLAGYLSVNSESSPTPICPNCPNTEMRGR